MIRTVGRIVPHNPSAYSTIIVSDAAGDEPLGGATVKIGHKRDTLITTTRLVDLGPVKIAFCFYEKTPQDSVELNVSYVGYKSFFRKYHITPIHPQRIDYVDTRYLVACSGCGIALLPHTTIRNSSTGQNPVYGTIKGDTLYRYVIVARKKGRNLSPSAEIVWRYMISASAKNR